MEVSWANLRTILLLVSLIVSCGDFVYGAALYEATFALELSFGFTLPFPALNMSSQGSIFPLDSNDIGRILSSSENLELRLESPTTTENRPSKTRISRRSGPGDLRPTPAPTGTPSSAITVHINNEHDFSILLPGRPQESIADAENDGVAYCSGDSQDSACLRHLDNGFIRAVAVTHSDDSAWVQVTGCIDPSKSHLDPSDDGGQFDVRFPNGAQCSFGGYGASFIEQVEPSANRFCLRCCASANDQDNCNSHQDRAGCAVAIPGRYSFPELGVDCS